MLKRVWMAVLAAAVLAGCAQNPSTQSGQSRPSLPSKQTVALKQPAHAVLLKGNNWSSNEVYRITAITGSPWGPVSSVDGELWLVTTRMAGIFTQEKNALRWQEINQLKYARVNGEPVYYVSQSAGRDASDKSMTAYRSAVFYVCEPGANPKVGEAGCIRAEKFTASMFYASETSKPNDAPQSFEMRTLLNSLGSNEATSPLTAEDYANRRAKWLAAYEKDNARKIAEKKRMADDAARLEQLARDFLTKSKKGTHDSCRSLTLLANGEPASAGTGFECAGSRLVSLGELQNHGWAVRSMMRERTTNAYGVGGNVVMITVEKTR